MIYLIGWKCYMKNKEPCIDCPDKEEILKLLNSVHDKGVPNWTTSDLQLVRENLKLLTYLWFRVEL